MDTHCEMEAQVPIGCGVQVGGAHSPLALLLEDQRRARLDLAALRPEHSAIYVPAEEIKNSSETVRVKTNYVTFMRAAVQLD